MTRKAIELSLGCLLLCFTALAGPSKTGSSSKISVREYIKQWSPVAKSNMTKYRIPASITLAQGILESGYGNSRMAKMANNHFGIKCLGWKGEGYYQQNSQRSCYRKYRDTEECFMDHARIISSKERYQFLFDLDITDYRAWAKGLKKAGYATNTAYDQLLIRTIEEYKLYDIDRQIAKPGKKSHRAPEVKAPVILELPEKEAPIETIDRLTKDIIIQIDNKGDLLEEAEIVILPAPDDFEVREPEIDLVTVNTKRVIAQDGDSYESIALAQGLTLDQLLGYNDLEQVRDLVAGMPVYLEQKESKANVEMCSLRPNQQLWEVAQRYGVRLNVLERKNHVRRGENLPSGTIIRLR